MLTSKYFTKPISLKWRILIPFIAVLALLIVVFAYTVFAMEGNQLQERLKHDIGRIATYQKDSMVLRGEKLVAIADTLARDHRLVQALLARDPKLLSAYGAPVLERINKEFEVTHLSFLDSKRQMLLRVHNPSLYGNKLGGTAALDAERDNEPAVGVALGRSGSYVVRAVAPVHDDDRLIGYIALGEDVMDSLVDLSRAFGVDGYVLLYKSYLARDDWERFMRVLGRKPEWERYPEMVISAQTRTDVPKAMDDLLTETEQATRLTSTTVEARKQLYNIGSAPLLDSAGRKIGRLVIVHNVTELNRQTSMRLFMVIGITTAVGVVLSLFFHFLLRRTERDLDEAHGQIADSVKAREAEQLRHIDELTGRIGQLERFEKLTVNREMRIKALKEENRRLKALSGAGGEAVAPSGDGSASDEQGKQDG